MIDVSIFFLIKPMQLDAILASLGIQIPIESYFVGLILTNIFAYLLIILFIILGLYVVRRIKRMIRRALT